MFMESQGLAVAGFAAGYAAVLATPGPNVLAIGSLAALQGFRATLPLCAGIGTGALILAVSIQFAFDSQLLSPVVEQFGRALAAALLLYVAVRMLASRPKDPATRSAEPAASRDKVATFFAGASTAATNPITGAYFASQLLAPVSNDDHAMVVLALVPLQAIAFGLTIAFILARPSARQAAIDWHRPIRLASSAVLAAMAILMARPLIAIA